MKDLPNDAEKVADWLGIAYDDFIDMNIELSMEDLICAGVEITPESFEYDTDKRV